MLVLWLYDYERDYVTLIFRWWSANFVLVSSSFTPFTTKLKSTASYASSPAIFEPLKSLKSLKFGYRNIVSSRYMYVCFLRDEKHLLVTGLTWLWRLVCMNEVFHRC